jgi:hypothetical protein
MGRARRTAPMRPPIKWGPLAAGRRAGARLRPSARSRLAAAGLARSGQSMRPMTKPLRLLSREAGSPTAGSFGVPCSVKPPPPRAPNWANHSRPLSGATARLRRCCVGGAALDMSSERFDCPPPRASQTLLVAIYIRSHAAAATCGHHILGDAGGRRGQVNEMR